jgi:hypothetical protein
MNGGIPFLDPLQQPIFDFMPEPSNAVSSNADTFGKMPRILQPANMVWAIRK